MLRPDPFIFSSFTETSMSSRSFVINNLRASKTAAFSLGIISIAYNVAGEKLAWSASVMPVLLNQFVLLMIYQKGSSFHSKQ